MSEFNDVERRAEELANHLQVYVTAHPLDTIRLMGHNPDIPLDHDSHIRMDKVVMSALNAYWHFVGPSHTLDKPVSYEEVEDLVSDLDWQNEYFLWGHEDEVATIAHRYLNGDGEDYELFLQFY